MFEIFIYIVQGYFTFLSLQIKGHQRVPSDYREFRERTKQDALNQLQRDLDNLLSTAPSEKHETIRKEFEGFAQLFERFLAETGPSVDWSKIQKLPEDAVQDYSTLETPPDDIIRSMLNKLIVIKLNGGLGTSMGCHGPKSVISVRNDLTFLDLTVQQIEVRVKINNFCCLFIMFFFSST